MLLSNFQLNEKMSFFCCCGVHNWGKWHWEDLHKNEFCLGSVLMQSATHGQHACFGLAFWPQALNGKAVWDICLTDTCDNCPIHVMLLGMMTAQHNACHWQKAHAVGASVNQQAPSDAWLPAVVWNILVSPWTAKRSWFLIWRRIKRFHWRNHGKLTEFEIRQWRQQQSRVCIAWMHFVFWHGILHCLRTVVWQVQQSPKQSGKQCCRRTALLTLMANNWLTAECWKSQNCWMTAHGAGHQSVVKVLHEWLWLLCCWMQPGWVISYLFAAYSLLVEFLLCKCALDRC